MKFNTILFGSIISLLSVCSMAEDNYCASWGCVSTIDQLYTNKNGLIYVATPIDGSTANCTLHAGIYFVLDPGGSNADKIYSTLLAAYFSESKIQLRIIEGSPMCEISYVRLSKQF